MTAAQDLLLRIGGDSSGGQQAAQQLADVLANSLAKALRDTGTESETSGTKVSGLQKLLDDLTPSTKNAHAAFTDLQGTLKGMWDDPKQGVSDLAKALASELQPALGAIGIGAGVAAGALAAIGFVAFEIANKVAEVGASIERGAIISNISAESFSALKFAVEATGGSVETLSNAAFMLERRLGDAGATGDKTRDALHQLGISADDFVKLPVDQQLLAISEGFRGLGAGANTSAIAFDLLGRQGREMLPTFMQPMDELVQKSKDLGLTWSETDVKAAHDFEIQLATLRAEVGKLSTDIGKDLIPAFTGPMHFAVNSIGWVLTSPDSIIARALMEGKTIGTLIGAADALDAPAGTPKAPGTPSAFGKDTSIATQTAAWSDYFKVLDQGYADADKAAKAFKESVAAAVASLAGTGEQTQVTIAALTQLAKSNTTNTDIIDRMAAEIEKLRKEHIALPPAVEAWADANVHLHNVTNLLLTGPLAGLEVMIPDLSDRQAHLQDVLADLDSTFNEFHDGITVAGDEISTVTIPLFTTLPDVVAQNTKAIDDAREATDKWVNSFKAFPNMIADLVSGNGGLSSAIKSVSNEVTNDLFGSKGALSGITKGLQSSVSGLLGGGAFGDMFGKMASSILPGLGGIISTGLSMLMNIGGPSQQELDGRKVESTFQNQFGSFQGMMDAVGKAYAATGRSAQQAQADVKALMDAETQGGDAATAAANKIKGAFDEQTQDAADLQTAIQKYGFTLDQLGPTMQKQQLDQQAQTLLNDWRLLVGSGIDVSTVNTKMASSVQDYLKMALKTGQEVPEAMKPILQSMIDQGTLTDANGNKITDMSQLGVSFSETMTEGFQKVVDKLDQLLTKIGLVPAALNKIPKTVDIDLALTASGGAKTDPIPSFDNRPLEAVTRQGLVMTHPGDVVGVPKPGMFGGGITINVAGSVWSERDLSAAVLSNIDATLRERYRLRPG